MVVDSYGKYFVREKNIRRNMAKIFNKLEDEFQSLKDYNDYLEEVEDMTCNLNDGIDVAAIEAKVSKYQAENAEQIMNSHARKAEQLEAALAASKGTAHADTETAMYQNSQTAISTTQGQYVPAIAGGAFMQPRPMGPQQPVPLGGSDMNFEDEETMRLRAEKGGRAGGWTLEFHRKRVLEEAFGSLSI